MRKSLLFPSFLLGSILTVSFAQAQNDRFAYAVTDIQKEGANWCYLRKLNLQTGQFTAVLLNGTEPKQVAYDAVSKKEIASFGVESNRGYNIQPAFSSGVAAMAYDKRNSRLWYTPMFIDQLRYIDLKTMKVYYVASQEFTGMARKSADQGNIITRMTIADDGNGYALTNDGAHLIRFTTGKNLTVTDLGRVADNQENKTVSIHNSCSSFGGDMIADNNGNLILFSAANYVFKINLESMVATFLGNVKGLTPNFTTNGAAVTTENTIVLGSAVNANSYFVVDPKTLEATAFAIGEQWRSSDLANSNILNTKTDNNNPAIIANKVIPSFTETGSNLVQLYPNPVTNSRFTIQFTNLQPGVYTLQLTDVSGKQTLKKTVTVTGEDQVENIRISAGAAKGFYLVKILDNNSKTVYSKKLIVQ